MQFKNTPQAYGSVTKSIHWLMFLMIVTVIPVGVIATDLAQEIRDPAIVSSTEDFSRAYLLFSLHKTLGIAIFLVALARILWALVQPRPGLLNPERRVEAFAAHMVHWLLYGSLLLVPLLGWMTHAATTGFAPIRWPFGQSLPFVPKDPGLAITLAGIHVVLGRVMVLAIVLHVAGALKHAILDRDATLRRMLPGRADAPPPPEQRHGIAPLLAAIGLWLAALGLGVGVGTIAPWVPTETTASQAPQPARTGPASEWLVQDGALTISITQLGNRVQGQFATWSATIAFSDGPGPGVLGKVDVVIDIASLTLGSVGKQAMGPDFLDADFFPEASFSGEITRTETGYVATGPLTIRDTTMVVELPFDLTLEGDIATMEGRLSLNRLDYGIGAGMADDASLGWLVDVAVSLTAQRQ